MQAASGKTCTSLVYCGLNVLQTIAFVSIGIEKEEKTGVSGRVWWKCRSRAWPPYVLNMVCCVFVMQLLSLVPPLCQSRGIVPDLFPFSFLTPTFTPDSLANTPDCVAS
ncbi:hypothetical protein F5Y18DRAFT_338729 [Xylariaceae sp. FL1019]|nr:hypothetical protein F5Y18DRAFT_338729 [Xylariaceae sp. FL1019]